MNEAQPIWIENTLAILTVVFVTGFLWVMIQAGCIMYDRHHKRLMREAIIEAHQQIKKEGKHD
jgi:hypothetical protein